MLHEHGHVTTEVAKARLGIDASRLVVLNAAVKIDKADAKSALKEISEAKILVPSMLCKILDSAIQIYGGAGVSQDTPLAYMWASARTMRLVDGPDEVHMLQLGRRESRRADYVRARIQAQKDLEEKLFQLYDLQKADPLQMGWTSETKPKL
jgi:acyl-CoA dehydrogenase